MERETMRRIDEEKVRRRKEETVRRIDRWIARSP